jgi:hypothetical protein
MKNKFFFQGLLFLLIYSVPSIALGAAVYISNNEKAHRNGLLFYDQHCEGVQSVQENCQFIANMLPHIYNKNYNFYTLTTVANNTFKCYPYRVTQYIQELCYESYTDADKLEIILEEKEKKFGQLSVKLDNDFVKDLISKEHESKLTGNVKSNESIKKLVSSVAIKKFLKNNSYEKNEFRDNDHFRKKVFPVFWAKIDLINNQSDVTEKQKIIIEQLLKIENQEDLKRQSKNIVKMIVFFTGLKLFTGTNINILEEIEASMQQASLAFDSDFATTIKKLFESYELPLKIQAEDNQLNNQQKEKLANLPENLTSNLSNTLHNDSVTYFGPYAKACGLTAFLFLCAYIFYNYEITIDIEPYAAS